MPGNFHLIKVLCVLRVFMGGANKNNFSSYKLVKIEVKILLLRLEVI